MIKVTITLEEENLRFVDKYAQANRSAYINKLLAEHRHKILEAEMIAGLQEDAKDPEYLTEIAAWDSIAGDGINFKYSFGVCDLSVLDD